MNKIIFCLCFASIAFAQALDVAKLSEAIGHMIGKNLNDLGIDFDLNSIVKGLQDEQLGAPSPLNDEECVEAITHLQEEKILSITERELQKANAISNGHLIEDENYPFSTPDSSKYR